MDRSGSPQGSGVSPRTAWGALGRYAMLWAAVAVVVALAAVAIIAACSP